MKTLTLIFLFSSLVWGQSKEINIKTKTMKMQITQAQDIKKQVSISIDRYNELTKDCEWQLLNAYIKNNCYITLWEHKKTGEEKESIGVYPPSEILQINYNGDPIGIGYDNEQPPKKLKVISNKKRGLK